MKISQLQEFLWFIFSTIAGASVIYIGFRLLDVQYGLFFGIGTFSPNFVIGLFFVTFIAGIVVAMVYGLGAKIVAHFPPLVVMIPQYFLLDPNFLPDNYTILPLGYWVLMLILAAEFCALGGFAGEALIKKTYGRRPKHLLHKRYKTSLKERVSSTITE